MSEENEVQLDIEDVVETEVEVVEENQPLSADEESDDDQFKKAESSTQKRIDRLTKKMRDAEREREEAIRYAQAVQNETQQIRQRMVQMDNSYVSEYGNRVNSQIQQAEAELAKAIELGDTSKIVESQRKITALSIQSDRATQARSQQEAYNRQLAAQAQQAQQYSASQAQPQKPRRPDPKAEDWAMRNEWFGQDEAMTYAAFGIHKRLVENEGFDPQSDEYYNELDRRLSEKFPNAANSSGKKRPAQTVASASRSTSGRSGKKVRLTPSQVAIAKKLGVPLEEYAKYVKE
jgi:hypothetical protein